MSDTSPENGPEQESLLRENPLIQSLRSSAAGQEPVTLLKGLLGRGEAENIWRLYLTLEMDEYIEFASSDVVHSQAVNESDSLAGTSVWVRRDTTLRYTHVASRQVQADFLRGDITTRHLGRARSASFGTGSVAETGYACTRNYVCSINPHIPVCQERTDVCGSIDCPPTGPLWPSGEFTVCP
jgi:hypothetical protein